MKIVDIQEKEIWDEYVTSRQDSNFLQSWDFYEFHKARGKKVIRRAIINDSKKIIGVYAGVVETAKRGTYLAIAGGPLIDFSNSKVVSKVFDDIKTQGKALSCVFVRIRPQEELSSKTMSLFKKHRLKPAPMYLSVEYAGILDLHKSEEEILAGASQGFRRKLRKAYKSRLRELKK
jgi:lipid II:glycine glycyltransferase (peptidoglycan interpeptide bridge formation enzyme)